MNKFKQWMQVTHNIDIRDNDLYVHQTNNFITIASNQMLLGYRIEYLLLTGKISWRRLGGWLEERMKERQFLKKGVVLNGGNHIKVINDILKQKIKESK